MSNDHSKRVYESILGLLSNEENPTPLVRLNNVVPFQHTQVFAKLEWYNPFGAVKDRIADNLKKSGAFIPGIRPGEQTSKYIDKVMTRLALAGAMYITFVCLVPQFMIMAWDVQFYFGGTSLLIIVVVIMDFMAQVQTHMMSHQYDNVLKKANLKGYGR